jgi:hypothetical protein
VIALVVSKITHGCYRNWNRSPETVAVVGPAGPDSLDQGLGILATE